MNNLIRFFRIFMKKYIKINVFLIILAIIDSCIGVLIPKVYQYIIDTTFLNQNYREFVFLIVIVVIAYLTMTGISYMSGILATKMSEHILSDVRTSLFEKIIAQKLGYFNKSKVGKEVSKIETDVDNLESLVSNGFCDAFSSILSFILTTYMMLRINVGLTFITIFLMLIYIFFSRKLVKKTKIYSRKIMEAKENILAFMTEIFHKIKTVKIYTMEKAVKNNHIHLQKKVIETNVKMAKIQVSNIEFSYIVFKGAEVIVWLISGLLILKGDMTLGMLTAFLSYQASYFEPIRSISELNGIIGSSLASIDRILSILDLEDEDTEKNQLPELENKLSMHNIEFSYGKKKVLQDINLEIFSGETIALIGRNGAGKTTIIDLLERLYAIDKGEILWDGKNIDNFSIQSLRQRIAVLTQNVNLFNLSIRDNLGITNSNHIKAIELIDLLKMDKWIEKLPYGIDTYINENESNLSGGEKQKIGILRTLIKEADILIMDEPANSLDREQRRILDQILEYSSIKIKIIITHDIEEIRMFQRVVFLNEGRIVADGRPDEILYSNEELMKIYGGK